MNHLLHQLETGRYILRYQQSADRRHRVVRLTERGWAAHSVIQRAMARLEQEWYQVLGEDAYDGLSCGLERLESVLLKEPTSYS